MPRLSCGVQCTRGGLFAINILFLIVGFIVLGVGVYIQVHGRFSAIAEIYSISEALGDNTMQWVGIGLITAGVLTACLAGFGCLGACLNNRCCLYIYALFLTLIVCFEFGAVISILVFRTQLWQSYDSGFMEIFHEAYSKNTTATIKIIENLETEFQCCGVNGADDYEKYGYPIPKSCYPQRSQIFHPYFQGCADAVVTWISDNLPVIAGTLTFALFIEIFGIIAALVLSVALSHSSQTPDYEDF